jgi:DNA repair protein RecO (recombination protein O)
MAKTETIEAICLKSFPYGESSRIAVFWSRTHGDIRAIVKGVRKPNSPLTGACEALTHAHLVVRKTGGNDLYQVVSVSPGERFVGLRSDLRCVTAAHMLVEWLLCNRLDPHSDALFDWLLNGLYALATLPHKTDMRMLVMLVHQYQMNLLDLTGMTLDLGQCAHCGCAFNLQQPIYFVPAWGSALCRTCRAIERPATQLVGLSAATWQVLQGDVNAWMTVDLQKLQQFWMFLAQNWWRQELTAHQFWIDQLTEYEPALPGAASQEAEAVQTAPALGFASHPLMDTATATSKATASMLPAHPVALATEAGETTDAFNEPLTAPQNIG